MQALHVTLRLRKCPGDGGEILETCSRGQCEVGDLSTTKRTPREIFATSVAITLRVMNCDSSRCGIAKRHSESDDYFVNRIAKSTSPLTLALSPNSFAAERDKVESGFVANELGERGQKCAVSASELVLQPCRWKS